jgi:hypothetical protein
MKGPARKLDFKRPARKIRKKRIAAFKQSVRELGSRWKIMMTEMEGIYRSIENAPDLCEDEKGKLRADFTEENEAAISEWITGIQSSFESIRHKVGRSKTRKKQRV